LSEPKPYLTIKPKKGWVHLDLYDLWLYRDLLMQLATRDLKLRYKQTALGVIWVVLQPLMAAGIFSFVFGAVAGLKAPGQVPYFLFSYAGMLGWNLFSGTLSKVSGCLVGNANLISKVYFPRLILPLSNIPSVMVDFVVALVMMFGLMLFYGVMPNWTLLLLPVWIAALLALALGIGLTAASLAVSYRDINYILPVFLQMLLYASPIAYAVSSVPESFRLLFYLNPLSGILEAFRYAFLGGDPPNPLGLAITVIASFLLLLVGLTSFKQMEKQFADVV
jgi:lipopolysaccharide transport system permease protein